MFIFSYIAAVLSLCCLGTAAFIFVKRRDYLLARYFAAYLFFVGIWVGSNAMADFATGPVALRFWSGLALFGGSFFVSSYLAFIEFFVTERSLSLVKKIVFFGPSVVFSCLGPTTLYVAATYFPSDQPTEITLGVLNYAVLIFTTVGMAYALVRPLLRIASAPPRRKWQIAYVSIGFFVTMAGAITFAILLPVFGETRFYTLGSEFAAAAVVASAYAIFKHELLDIRVVIQKSVVYALFLAMVIGAYLALVFAMDALLGPSVQAADVIGGGLAAVIGAIGAPFVKGWFERATDRIFFKDKYDYAAALKELSEGLNRSIDEKELLRHAQGTLQKILKVDDIHIELEGHGTAGVAARSAWELTVPIRLEEKTIGALCLGKKKSGDPYSPADERLLETFGYQAGVAFEKARLYEEVRQYSAGLETKVKERTAEIKALQERQKNMLVDISHGVQTPLTVARTEVDVLKKDFPNDERLGIIARSIDETSKLVYDFLDMAQLERAENGGAKALFDMSILVDEIVEYLGTLAEQRDITIEADIVPGMVVLGARDKMSECITNILSNAVKYMDPKREKKIIVTLRPEEKSVLLVVKDTGIGIDAEDIPHIFERFYRAADKRTAHIRGSGLGLSIAKQIVKSHGGSVMLASAVGHGTTVTIRLPIP